MYKIINTTDHKYLGVLIDNVKRDITFPDGFVMKIMYTKRSGNIVEVSNSNYIITLRDEG